MDYSVVVAGGGPAGALAALKLARSGARVLVVDRDRPHRVEAAEILPPEGREILEREAIWRRIPLHLTWPCPAMAAAWQQPELVWTSFDRHPLGLAWHIDRIGFDAWMLSEIRAAGVEVGVGTIDGAERDGGRWRIDVSVEGSQRRVSSRTLIVATGRSSRALRLARRHRIDNLCLIAGTTDRDEDEPDALIVEAVSDGWWYSAPLVDGRLFTGWMTDFALVGDGRYEEAAIRSLAGAPIHAARVGTPRMVNVIGSATWVMSPSAGEGWIAVGDAALARDPIGGDGLTSALRSACHAAEVVAKALEGDDGVWPSAAAHTRDIAERYLHQRLELYRAARVRWPSSTFWRRFDDPPR